MLRSVIHSLNTMNIESCIRSYADQERHKGELATAETADYAKWLTFSAYRLTLPNRPRTDAD